MLYSGWATGPKQKVDVCGPPALAELATDADVPVHEVMYLPGIDATVKRVSNASRLREHLLASHTVTEDVRRIAQAAGLKAVVLNMLNLLNHFVPRDDPSIIDDMWSAGVRKHFSGEVSVGKDLMQIRAGRRAPTRRRRINPTDICLCQLFD